MRVVPSVTSGLPAGFLAQPFTPVHPQTAARWGMAESLSQMERRIGQDTLEHVLAGGNIASPVAHERDGEWLKTAKIVGINPRAVGTYWGIIKYAMTFPDDAIHLLPLYEPGCNGSLYAPVNWRVNDEFLSPELSEMGFITAEDQLRLTVRLLHALGKKVGMDVVPHTDRFSETVLLHPDFFGWIHLNSEKTMQIASHEGLADDVKRRIADFMGDPDIFSRDVSADERSLLLFGPPSDKTLRAQRRLELMQWVRDAGYETLPVPYYKPSHHARFDHMETGSSGETWPVFSVPGHSPKQIFGSLTPYRFSHTDDDGFRPHVAAREFFAEQVVKFQEQFGFDFMRADKALHFREVNPNPMDEHEKGIWRFVKENVRRRAPYFASFAEHFVEDPRGRVGDPYQNIEADGFDATLGNLQYSRFSPDFSEHVRRFNLAGLIHGTTFKIANTVSTIDSDNRDKLYTSPSENLLRFFLAYFLNQPAYISMGFETREVVADRGLRLSARHYIQDDLKNREGDYLWGDPGEFFARVSALRNWYVALRETLQGSQHWWLDVNHAGILSWMYFMEPGVVSHMFVANVSGETGDKNVLVQNPFSARPGPTRTTPHHGHVLLPLYSTLSSTAAALRAIQDEPFIPVSHLGPSEARIYLAV